MLGLTLSLRHGYGTNWQQLVVLTYAGLRGAVGLTLALIVQVCFLVLIGSANLNFNL